MSLSVEFRFRRGSTADWEASDPVLSTGEPGYDTTSNRLKIGNGLDRWSLLPYIASGGGDPASATDTFVYQQMQPLATWTITHSLSRNVGVTIYVNGKLVETEVSTNSNQVIISWPYPVSGTAVLT